MGNGISFWGTLVIMIIVAAVASLITISITGNVAKDNQISSNEDIYTKEEVDLMIATIKEDLKSDKETSSNLNCDVEDLCEVNSLFALGNVELSTLSTDSALRTDNTYVCTDKSGKLFRGTATGCR